MQFGRDSYFKYSSEVLLVKMVNSSFYFLPFVEYSPLHFGAIGQGPQGVSPSAACKTKLLVDRVSAEQKFLRVGIFCLKAAMTLIQKANRTINLILSAQMLSTVKI
jgi:hypothetical protein